MESVPLEEMQGYVESLYTRHYAVSLESFEQRLRSYFILVRQTTCHFTRVLFHLSRNEPVKSGLAYLQDFTLTLFKEYPHAVSDPHPLTNDHYVFSLLHLIVNNKQDLIDTIMLLAKTQSEDEEGNDQEDPEVWRSKQGNE